jgi:hypothetical protein
MQTERLRGKALEMLAGCCEIGPDDLRNTPEFGKFFTVLND